SGRAATSPYCGSGPSRSGAGAPGAGSGCTSDGSSSRRSMLPPMPNIARIHTHTAQPAIAADSQVRAPASSARTGHPRGGRLQVAGQVEARVHAAAAAAAATELVALGEDVEVVDEQARSAAFQRVQYRGQLGVAARQAHLHGGARQALLAHFVDRLAVADRAAAVAGTGLGHRLLEPLHQG